MPHEFLYAECLKLGIKLPETGKYGVGMVFFPKEPRWREECREIIQRCAEKLGLEILGYRKVPVRPDGIGETALSVEPEIEQLFIACPYSISDPEEFERKLFVLRNYITKTVRNSIPKDKAEIYFASAFLQNDRIQRPADHLPGRPLLYRPRATNAWLSAFGLIHSRFCHQHLPQLETRASFRYIAPNGEINTLKAT